MIYPHEITTWTPGAATFDASGNPSAEPRSVSYQGKCFRQDAPRGLIVKGDGDEAIQATEVAFIRGECGTLIDDRFVHEDFRGRVIERTYARGRFYTRLALLRDDTV